MISPDRTGSNLPNRWITQVRASAIDSNTAFIAFSGYDVNSLDTANGGNGNIGKVFKTSDAGATWVDISGNLTIANDMDIPICALVACPLDESRLWIGTDWGVMTSSNSGSSWSWMSGDMPDVAVMALDYNTVTGYLSAATFGRGVWRTRPATAAAGSAFIVQASDVEGLGDVFYNTPKIVATDFTIPFKDRPGSATLKIDTPVRRGVYQKTGLPAVAVVCDWASPPVLKNQSAINAAIRAGSSMSEAIVGNQIQALKADLRADTTTERKTKLSSVTQSVIIRPPLISGVYFSQGIMQGAPIIISGWDFGQKTPNVTIEFLYNGKYRYIKCKMSKELIYRDLNGKQSIMDPYTGASCSVAIYPRLTQSQTAWTATGVIVLDNGRGYAVYSYLTHQAK